MSKKKLTLEQEVIVLHYLEYHRDKAMKGEQRGSMYDVYRLFSGDRDASVCSCLDRDTHRKVDNFINNIDWSEETRQSAKMKQVLPHLYIEPIEEESTQPIDMSEVVKGMNKSKKVATKRRPRKKKE